MVITNAIFSDGLRPKKTRQCQAESEGEKKRENIPISDKKK